MPTVTLDLAKEIAISSKEQKVQLVEEISEVVARITNRPKETVTVFIRLHELENVGVGGTLLSDWKF